MEYGGGRRNGVSGEPSIYIQADLEAKVSPGDFASFHSLMNS